MVNSNTNSDTTIPDSPIGPMDVGYILFTIPFIVFCIALVGMVVASYF
jgi:hypothetical protein